MKTTAIIAFAALAITSIIGCNKATTTVPTTLDLSLITNKQWKTDTLYYSYTVATSTGTLEYARGGGSNLLNFDNSRAAFWSYGQGDIFDNSGNYESWSWSVNSIDNSALILVTPGGTVHAKILKLDATHFNYYDSTNHALDVLINSSPSVPIQLFAEKQWETDSLYYNYTVATSTGTLEYARGASNNIINADNSRAAFWSNGQGDVFDIAGNYESWSWSVSNTDNTALILVTPGGTVHAKILKLDATHFNYYDSTNQALDVLSIKP
jgi:hypothetical protein